MIYKRKRLLLLVVCLLIVSYVVCLSVFIINLNSDAKTHVILSSSPDTAKVADSWQYRWGDSSQGGNGNFAWMDDRDKSGWTDFEFPGRPVNSGGYRNIWIRAVLPQGRWDEPTLRFRAPQQSVEVFVGGKLIYTFGKMDFTNTLRTPGSIWHLVPLPEGFQGKTVYFRIYSPYTFYTGYLIEIETGSRSSHILNIIRQNALGTILGSLFTFLGIISLILSALSANDRKSQLALGIGCFCLGVWYVAEGKILQLFVNAPVAPTYIANLAISFAPAGVIAYVGQLFTSEGSRMRTLLNRLWQASLLLPVLAMALDMLNIAPSLQFDTVLNVMIVILMAPVLFAVIRAARSGNISAYIFLTGLTVLCLTGLYDIYDLFYETVQNDNPSRISYWGMLVFVLSLVVISGRHFGNIYKYLKTDSLQSRTNYESLFANMADGFIYGSVITDDTGKPADLRIIEANRAFTQKAGAGSLAGTGLSDVFPEIRDMDTLNDCLSEEAAAGVRLCGRWYKVSAYSPRAGFLGMIFSDITYMKEAEELIRRQAYIDSLTGFYNRTYFEEMMVRMNKNLEGMNPISIIVIDIDGLKITNDTFGHKMGDNLIKEASKIIFSVFGPGELIARIGGDEFCILLPNTDRKTAQLRSESLIHSIDRYNGSSPAVPISMSVGFATSGENCGGDIYEIYKRADDDMYQYKISQSGSEKSQVIDLLMTALSERDYVSQGHVNRLANMAEMMADTMKLQEMEKRNLVLLSKVHDLGKIGVPDEILNKPASLTLAEYDKMKEHVKIGFNIARRSKELIHISKLILHHHEHWDGKGYPDGLKGEEIPLECRILGVLDAYDAMTSKRPYHEGMKVSDALREIKRCSGSQFDPSIAGWFIMMHEALL